MGHPAQLAEALTENPVHGRDQRSEGQQHGNDIDGQFHAFARAGAGGVNAVDGLAFDLGGRTGGRFAGLGLRDDDLGDKQCGRCAHHAGREQVTGWNFEQTRINPHHAARDGGETPDHHAVQFASGHSGQIGLDDQRGFGLPHENVGRGAQCFAATRPHGPSHDPGGGPDHELQESIVVEHR